LSDALRASDIEAAFSAKIEPIGKAEEGWVFSGGLDLSVSRDFTAFVVVGKHTVTNRYRVCRVRLWRPANGAKVDQAEVEEALRQGQRDKLLNRLLDTKGAHDRRPVAVR
jgi:phage terminase large subunit-like protein